MSNRAKAALDLMLDDLEPVEHKFTFREKEYILCEASGDAACKWRNALTQAAKIGPDGRPVALGAVADTEPLLISLCLFEDVEEKGQHKRKNVQQSVIRSWPNRLQRRLFDTIQDISELVEKETPESIREKINSLQERLEELEKAGQNGEGDRLKNSPGLTTPG